MISKSQMDHLLHLYENTSVFHGELHDHSASGGTSDGKCTLSEWIERMNALEMDFAAILDHRQIRHMYLPEWSDGLFIPGTEPGTLITDSVARNQHMHYNILLSDRNELNKILSEFPEYEWSGGIEGHFVYPTFTRERFGQLIDAVKAHGGFFVHPHPKQLMDADDPAQYWFRDGTGIEVIYMDFESEHTKKNYALWLELLKAGKRVYACAGGDLHAQCTNRALTTLYAKEKTSSAYLHELRRGNFTCGQAGIRMTIGDTVMGGACDFVGRTLTASVADFHKSVFDPACTYRADIITDKGTEASFPVSPDKSFFFSMECENCAFYRIEVFNETEGTRIAIGNPIWNEKQG